MSSEGPWLTTEQQHVWRRWLAVNAALPAVLHRDLQESGLSLPDFEVLVHLTDTPEGRLRVTDLADVLHWERSRLSHHVKRMEARALVRREECPEDKRGAFVVLTTAGRVAIESAAPSHAATVREVVFAPLTADELDSFGAITGKVLASLAHRTGE
jgi:DNA-binding MarR family transcriptional regulator